jgi:hypothetical protein
MQWADSVTIAGPAGNLVAMETKDCVMRSPEAL